MDWIEHQLFYGSGWRAVVAAGLFLVLLVGSELLLAIWGRRLLRSKSALLSAIGVLMLTTVFVSISYMVLAAISVATTPEWE